MLVRKSSRGKRNNLLVVPAGDMYIQVYLYNEYNDFALKILQLLEKNNLEFECRPYSTSIDIKKVSKDIGSAVRKLPQVVVDGDRIGGYYDLVEHLINKGVIHYDGGD